MKLAMVPLALLATALASARSLNGDTSVHIHVGYGLSPSFDSHTVQGLDLGVALPLGSFLKSGVYLEPSVFGGALIGGGDDPAVYRLTAFLHRTFSRGVGARVGVGYSNSTRRGDIDGRSGVIFDLGVEIPFEFRLIQKAEPYADVHGILSSEERLEGIFFGVGIRL